MSGTGFGSTFTVCRTKWCLLRWIGVWKPDKADESSNWRKLTNVVESLEKEAESGRLDNAQDCFFADNTTVEAALHKGLSKSKKLLGLAIQVKLCETK
jgi:hypothetical protein